MADWTGSSRTMSLEKTRFDQGADITVNYGEANTHSYNQILNLTGGMVRL
jgi:hypothetical protein